MRKFWFTNLKPKNMNNPFYFYLICDNIRSRENVGAIFRTADALGISKIFLAGITPCPPHPKIEKTALGAEKYVPFECWKQGWRLAENLKKQNIKIIALEQTPQSIPLNNFKISSSLALIIGNEVNGISKSLLKRADEIIYIPMFGKKKSLNVSVAFGIAGYGIKFQILNLK